MKKRLVLIEWLDSQRTDGWHTDKPATKPLRCLSAGWLMYDGKEAKTIAAHISDEESPQRSGEMTIPARAILSIRDLE